MHRFSNRQVKFVVGAVFLIQQSQYFLLKIKIDAVSGNLFTQNWNHIFTLSNSDEYFVQVALGFFVVLYFILISCLDYRFDARLDVVG